MAERTDGTAGTAGTPGGIEPGFSLDGIGDPGDFDGGRPGSGSGDNNGNGGTSQGPTANPSPGRAGVVLQVTQGTNGGGKGRKGKGSPKAEAQHLSKENGALLANVFLALFESTAVQMLGASGKFTPEERKLIEPALNRLVLRLPVSMAGDLQKWMDPAMLAVGITIYVHRQYEASRRGRAGEAPGDAQAVEVPPVYRNGTAPQASRNPTASTATGNTADSLNAAPPPPEIMNAWGQSV